MESRTLIVGFGSIGKRHARILRELGLKDLMVCDPAPDRLESARQQFGIAQTYEDLDSALAERPDLVFICSPTALHIEQAQKALQADADVFIEKPLSTSLDGIDILAKIAAQRKRIVMVGHCFRFHEGIQRARQWLDQGRIGRLLSIRCVMGEYIPDVMPDYRSRYVFHYGGAYELMHEIDLALWFAGRKPRRIFGLDARISDVGMDSPDLVETIIEFEERCTANVHLDFFQRARRRETELYGTEGTISVEFASWDRCLLSLYEASRGEWWREELTTDRDDMFRAEDRAFLESAASRTEPPVGIQDGRLAVEVLLAIQESSRTGKAIRFDGAS